MVKAELHAHTSLDCFDHVPHSAHELIVHMAGLGYGALAITLHDTVCDPAPLQAAARDHGIVLIPGLERTIRGKHVLLLNFPEEAIAVRSFEDLAALKARTPHALVIAPHPFFPIPSALGRTLLDRHADLWDAIEVSAMYVRGLDFNRRAIAWAHSRGRPLVGNGDIHRLSQLDATWSEVDVPAGADADAICDAIRAGRVRVVSTPLPRWKAGRIFADMTVGGLAGRLRAGRLRSG